ncbi:DNA topoisomerase VI subunit B [archaeon]|nr:DNA topoisomerase VI subunit B [archaeon]MBT4022548.1 DNA topoisomerase VI subunit B [archaeon]MBT4272874.1 DNA topoisomerase VI subunit B [archaeon]MBT4461674.1 DNA topoisomerase VI subunit B [archaeon]MBT4857558.1 DNA topoisomerase VI subunit B [archaeon]
MQKTLDLDNFKEEEKTETMPEKSENHNNLEPQENKMESTQTIETPNKEPKKNTKAHELAKKQRDISIAEFFEKNRHLLGFDNKKKALLTTIKEAVDNSLDACEEADILPELIVEIIDMGDDRYRVAIEDNGPGIVKAQIPKIFAKLLYGSKFHTLKQSRGQQGIGISASVMYGQLTTGRPARIISKIGPNHPANEIELKLDTVKNKPLIISQKETQWHKPHGTRIEIDLEGTYISGRQSVDQYIQQTAIINPHVTLIYQPPKGSQIMFVRATEKVPRQAKEIKPHPYGVELGRLMKMLRYTEYRTIQAFLTNEFARVGSGTAKQICENGAILPSTKPKKMTRELAEQLMKGIKETKIINPPADCISPIGHVLLEKGLKKEVNAEFYFSATRPPAVYRGNPFVIEAAIAYGGNMEADKSIEISRFANRVPLLYQQGSCAITKSIAKTNWRSYGLRQSNNSIPIGPCVLIIHMASVWVPFTSEAKEALAHYPEIMKEVRLVIQEIGRELGKYLNKKKRLKKELSKVDYISKYLPHVSGALQEILKLEKDEKLRLEEHLKIILEESRSIKKDELEELKRDFGPKRTRQESELDKIEGLDDVNEEINEDLEDDSAPAVDSTKGGEN